MITRNEKQKELPVVITIKQAHEVAKELGFDRTIPTIIAWVKKYQLGYRVGGSWQVQTEKFISYLKGEEPAHVDSKKE
uniref:Uncharacterized protein n=1 Tax=viral metagenome TaxID=1070528 RepID=A0A6M3IL97_9ZZZZ